ncbi:MAG: helix-turn-helix transcriptional regulator [Bacilli bacterium]|nr:helix-turn-helix transcriptional regulator [Bacilli bacterium]
MTSLFHDGIIVLVKSNYSNAIMDTYNYHLYRIRIEKGLNKRQMAKAIGISYFRYSFMENGYSKPTRKECIKISDYLGENFFEYTHGPSSNPSDLPDKRESKLARFAYETLGRLWVRIVLGALMLLSISFYSSHFFVNDFLANRSLELYPEQYQSFVVELQKKGTTRLSVTGEFSTPEYYESIPSDDGYNGFASIFGHYKGVNESALTFLVVNRGEDWRITTKWNTPSTDLSKEDYYGKANVFYTYYGSAGVKTLMGEATFRKGVDPIYSPVITKDMAEAIKDPSSTQAKGEDYDLALSRCQEHVPNVIKTIDSVIEKHSESGLKIEDLASLHNKGIDAQNNLDVYSFFAQIVGIVLAAATSFLFVFSLIYGRKKGAEPLFVRDINQVDELPEIGRRPLRRDWRIGPILPETIVVIIGIVLVYLGSRRLVEMTDAFFTNTFGSIFHSTRSESMMSLFVIGMFLLYYTDFDIFLEDKRVVWKIFMYIAMWIGVYSLELYLVNFIKGLSVFGQFAEMIPFPNMFLSIACYFMITFCLFFTPKFAKKKKWRLVCFRLLSIIPIAYMVVAWVLYRGDGVLFNLDWPIEVKYLFNGERAPFTTLGILYLVGYYFIRLYFIKKYGENNANIYFNSNRFIWLKNTYVALLILIIGIIEIILSKNPIARKLDLGYYSNILFLIPIVLLYHPHKGPRNRVFDWAINILYWLVLAVVYVTVAITAIIGLVMSVAP